MPNERREAPTEDEIKRWREYLRRTHDGRDTAIIELRLYRYQEKEVVIPGSLKHTGMEVRSNIIANQVDRVVGVLTYNDLVATVPLAAETGKGADQSNKLEPWYNALLKKLSEEAGRPLWFMGPDAQCGDGWSCYKFGYTPSKLGKKLRRRAKESAEDYVSRSDQQLKQQGLPFWVRDLDMLTVFPYWGPYGLERVIEVAKKPVIELERLYSKENLEGAAPGLPGHSDKARPSGETEEREVIEDWVLDRYEEENGDEGTVIHHTTLVDGKQVDHEELNWIRLPYFFARGILSHVRDPRKEGMSVAYQQLSLAGQIDVLLTIILNYAVLLPSLALKAGPNSNLNTSIDPTTNEPRHITFKPNEAPILEDTEIVMPFQGLSVGQEFQWVFQALMGLSAQAGPSNLLAGEGAGANEAGYTWNSRMNAALTQLHRIVTEHTTQVGELLSFIGWFVENIIKLPVHILADASGTDKPTKKWISAGPRDFNGYYLVDVARDPLLPQNEQSRGQFGTMLVKENQISERRNMEEYLGIENPEQENRQKLLEAIKREFAIPMLKKDVERMLYPRLAAPPPTAPASGLVDQFGNPVNGGGGGGLTPNNPSVGRLLGSTQATGNPPVEPSSLQERPV